MSSRPSIRRSVVSGSLAASALAVVLIGGGVASADPAPQSRTSCAHTVAHASSWPGTQVHGYRFVSDRYVSYLSGRPECTPDLTVR